MIILWILATLMALFSLLMQNSMGTWFYLGIPSFLMVIILVAIGWLNKSTSNPRELKIVFTVVITAISIPNIILSIPFIILAIKNS